MLDLPLPFRPVMALNFSSKPGTTTREAARSECQQPEAWAGEASQAHLHDTPWQQRHSAPRNASNAL